MPGSEPKTLHDDFIERMKKDFRPKFVENVDNPTLLVVHLRCLETIDEEEVMAQHRERGPMNAAIVLFDHLIKRPGWLEDLKRALREPGIKLDYLADELADSELTILAIWDISGYLDDDGEACFNGNCSSTNIVSGPAYLPENPQTRTRNIPETFRDEEQPTDEPDAAPMMPVQEQNAVPVIPVQEQNVAPLIPVQEQNVAPVNANPYGTQQFSANLSEEGIRLRREDLRIKLMEKVYESIQRPEDLAIAIHNMEKINIQIDRIGRGSVLISIYIGSLDALKTFEQLYRYGGLKKLLDKEMLDQDMMKELKKVGQSAGHPVYDIQSSLEVFDTDIERCRDALIRSNFGVRPMNFADTNLLLDTSKEKDKKLKAVAFYATESLPDELKSLLEDPFVSEKLTRFFESDFLRVKMQSDPAPVPKSVAQCFTEWLNFELRTYFESLDSDTKNIILTLAVYLVHVIEPSSSLLVPSGAMSEHFTMEEVKIYFPSEPIHTGYWFDMIKLPDEVVVNSITLKDACEELMQKNIMCRSKNNLNFHSSLVRDAFVTKVILCSSNKRSMREIVDSFEYVPTLIGLFEVDIMCYVSDEAKPAMKACCFKTNELKEIGISGTKEVTVSRKSSFYNSDLVSSRTVEVMMTQDIIVAGETIKRRLKEETQARMLYVDISDCIEDGLHWLNAVGWKQIEQGHASGSEKEEEFHQFVKGLSISKHELTDENLHHIGQYLNATLSASGILLRNCNLKSKLLASAFQTGHYRNIKHLNLSDNDYLFEGSSKPIGLMFISSLEKLEMQNCLLGDEGIKLLANDLQHLEKLRELNIASNRFTSRALVALIKAIGENRRLTGLRIHKNYLGPEGSFILASWLESLILLEVLNISECGIGDKGCPLIAKALVSRSLRKLSMRRNEISPKGSRDFFSNLQRSPYLEHLDFSENTLFAASDRSLAVAEDLSPTVKDEPFLSFLEQPTPLSHLCLWNTSLGEKRVFHGLDSCFKELTYLCLQENNISDEFAKDVSNCIIKSGCSRLQQFNLRQNRIGNMGALELAKALANQNHLKDVLLDRNEIGDDGANQIADSCIRLPNIQRIDLSCNNISRKMIESIVEDVRSYIGVLSGNKDTDFPAHDIVKKLSSFDESNFVIKRNKGIFHVEM